MGELHLFDLITMKPRFPDVHKDLNGGCFTFQKTKRPFSRMALDQLHEQNNKTIKGCGCATSLVNKADDFLLI